MGPLNGYTIIELAGIGPAPMAGMILADMGAEVIRIERAGAFEPLKSKDVSFRGKKSVVLNLKDPQGVEVLLRMVVNADCLIDPYRPGVCEKLGIGPDVCLQRNPRLVFGRMTGWGQEGPLANAAGHDINYISITGALYATGRAGEKPVTVAEPCDVANIDLSSMTPWVPSVSMMCSSDQAGPSSSRARSRGIANVRAIRCPSGAMCADVTDRRRATSAISTPPSSATEIPAATKTTSPRRPRRITIRFLPGETHSMPFPRHIPPAKSAHSGSPYPAGGACAPRPYFIPLPGTPDHCI